MKRYEIRFVTHWGVQTYFVPEGEMPTPPSVIDAAKTGIENFAEGKYFVQYWPELAPATEDATYTAIYSGESGLDAMRIALAEKPFHYQMHHFRDMQAAASVYPLLLEEHLHPAAGLYRDRLVSHFEALVAEGSAPQFDAICLWSYSIITALAAMARVTPTVWDALTEDTRQRLDTMMAAFAYLESFATADQNDYHTGPGLGGNYYKTWNPNYRLANVPCMVFAAYYFGQGDTELGARRVNDMLHAFDESVFDAMIERFRSYGWENALKCWTTEAKTADDGTVGKSTRELMCHGGLAVAKYTFDPSKLVASGTGLGVTLGGEDYLYRGIPLERPDEILKNVIEYNYSGGPVKSGHFWDVDGDGVAEQVAWILDGTDSPYFGRDGMMLEFASGNRSSTAYCDHDFTIAIPLMHAASTLVRYTVRDGERVPLLDAEGRAVKLFDYTADAALWERIQVGNEDFIYKLIHGYQGYSTGSYGEARHRGSESEASRGYFVMKSLWRTAMLPHGTVVPAHA